MANSDKNIVITPNRGLSGQPEISFTGAGNSTFSLKINDSSFGELEFKNSNENIFTVSANSSSTSSFSVGIGGTYDGVSSLKVDEYNVYLGTLNKKVSINSGGIKLPNFDSNQLPPKPKEGTLVYDKKLNAARCYNGRGWLVLGQKRDGLTPDTAAESARQILENYPNSYDGVYWYKTPEMDEPVQLFTDMTRDGGGWVMISRWGGYNKNYAKVFSAYSYNQHLLTRRPFLGYDIWGRLSRKHMNSLWNYSYGICRIHFKNDASTASSGIYFQSKLTNRQNFDLWAAHYNPLYWSDMNEAGGYQATGGGTYYEVSFANNITDPDITNYSGNGSVYNSFTNDIIGGTAQNANMGWWDKATLSGTNVPGLNSTLYIARHMGFFGDVNQGNQWLFTCNPSDSRWATNETRETQIYLRM